MPSAPEINQFNASWRQSPLYAEVMRELGVDTSRPIKLSPAQRKHVQEVLEAATGEKFTKGTEIDPAGNVNENEGFGKQAKRWGPIVGAAAVTMFGIPGFMPGLLSGGSGAAAASGAAFDAMPSAAAQAANMAAVGGGSAVAAGGSGMGMFGTLAGLLKDPKTIMSAAGKMLTGGAQAAASNRGAQLEAEIARESLDQSRQQAYRDAALRREQDRRESGKDAMRALQQAEYIANNTGYKPSDVKIAGQGMPSYGFGPKASTEAERAGAANFRAEAERRLAAQDSLLPGVNDPGRYQFDPKLLKGSTAEKLSGILGAGLDAYGSLADDAAGQRVTIEALKRLGIRT